MKVNPGMNSRERVLAAMRRQGPIDRFPFEISWGAFTPALMDVYRARTGATIPPDEYFDFDTRSVNLHPTRRQTDFSLYFREKPPEGVIFDEWGVGRVRGGLQHFVEYKYQPLADAETAKDVERFEWPDVTADYRYEGLKAKVAGHQSGGHAVTGELYQTIFEMAWLMRGMERLMMDFHVNPEIAHAICERLAQMRIKQAREYAGLDVDVLRLGDDVCMQTGLLLGLETYRKFLKERTRAVVKAAKEVKPDILIFMHCDGCLREMVEEYIDIGVDILNPVQPECNDLSDMARRFGRRISFWGGIGTQSTMPFAAPAEVRAKVQEVKAVLGREGGLLIAPSHILEPEVPWENVLAFVEEAKTS